MSDKWWVTKIEWGVMRKKKKKTTKQPLGFCISITHNSIFITHNSKIVGLTERKLIWICFHHSILWFLSDELWKLKTHFRCFQVMETKLWWQSCKYTHIDGPTSRNFWLHSPLFFFFFLFSTFLSVRLSSFSVLWQASVLYFFFPFLFAFLISNP